MPVVVRPLDDQAAMTIALIENIQRENLNPMEEARALERLIDEFDMTHQQAAEAVGDGEDAEHHRNERCRDLRDEPAQPEHQDDRCESDQRREPVGVTEIAYHGTDVGGVEVRVDVEPEQRLELADHDDDSVPEDVPGENRSRQEVADEPEPEHEPEHAPPPDEQCRQRRQLDHVLRPGHQRSNGCCRHDRHRRFGAHVEIAARAEQGIGGERAHSGVQAVHRRHAGEGCVGQ